MFANATLRQGTALKALYKKGVSLADRSARVPGALRGPSRHQSTSVMASSGPRAGEWPSPITTELVAGKSVRLGAPLLTQDGTLLWIEARPSEQGRQSLVSWTADKGAADITPLDTGLNVRTRVHEYGGGDYAVGGGLVVFSNFSDQRLYTQAFPSTGEAPKPLTPEGVPLRFADAVVDAARGRVIAVVEDHAAGEHNVKNYIAAIDLSTGEVTPLVQGADFYSSPRIDPSGKKLAWVQWALPHMPWDDTQLCVAELAADGAVGKPRIVAGGADTSVQQPVWGPEGELWFVWDKSGWWNLYRESAPGKVEHILPAEAEFGFPPWIFGMRTFTHLPGGFLLALCSDPKQAGTQLGLLDLKEARPTLKPLRTNFSSYSNAVSAVEVGGELVVTVVGASARRSQQVALLRVPSAAALLEAGPDDWQVIRTAAESQVDDAYLSECHAIEYPTAEGRTAHMYYYPPTNKDHKLADGELPPLKVLAHGGPTSAASTALALSIQYLTSRGFAVADINYGGSTGYGRDYRNRLRGQWGIVDVQDCCEAAKYLTAKGLADPKRCTIAGGSAGGYTVLACLAFEKVFSAGASYYGVADLSLLAAETHKFESRYLDSLIGPYPEAKATYDARSPLMHADGLNSPVAFFHGSEDKVVPVGQAEEMHAVLKAKGLPTVLVVYPGEQHGFRQAANIRNCIDGELFFFGRVFGFVPCLDKDFKDFPIDNLPAA